MARIRLGLVGIGKIARDQHLPVIAASDDFELVAVASRNAAVDGVPGFTSVESMIEAVPGVEAIAFCTPPVARTAGARFALSQGRHVMLEKPPGATLSEVDALIALAERAGVSLYASWHSRHAPAVAPAKAWLARRSVRSVAITWKEDIRVWHPGQDWIFEPGGLGVFDPGVNALSIVTTILPLPFALTEATLEVPANRQAPIAARLSFRDLAGAPMHAEFDFRQTGAQICDIHVETDDGALRLSEGGARLAIGGADQTLSEDRKHTEYESVYAEFASLVRDRRVGADLAPFQQVADAFLLGRRTIVEAFHF